MVTRHREVGAFVWVLGVAVFVLVLLLAMGLFGSLPQKPPDQAKVQPSLIQAAVNPFLHVNWIGVLAHDGHLERCDSFPINPNNTYVCFRTRDGVAGGELEVPLKATDVYYGQVGATQDWVAIIPFDSGGNQIPYGGAAVYVIADHKPQYLRAVDVGWRIGFSESHIVLDRGAFDISGDGLVRVGQVPVTQVSYTCEGGHPVRHTQTVSAADGAGPIVPEPADQSTPPTDICAEVAAENPPPTLAPEEGGSSNGDLGCTEADRGTTIANEANADTLISAQQWNAVASAYDDCASASLAANNNVAASKQWLRAAALDMVVVSKYVNIGDSTDAQRQCGFAKQDLERTSGLSDDQAVLDDTATMISVVQKVCGG